MTLHSRAANRFRPSYGCADFLAVRCGILRTSAADRPRAGPGGGDEARAQHPQPGDLAVGEVQERLLLDGEAAAGVAHLEPVPDPGAAADMARLHRLHPLDHVVRLEPRAEDH